MARDLYELFNNNGWDDKILDDISRLKRWWNRRVVWKVYTLDNPFSLYKQRDEIDSKLFYANSLIPFGSCPNGDPIVVCASNSIDGLDEGGIYIRGHEYSIFDIERLSLITRKIASNFDELYNQLNSSNCQLPRDYFEGNDNYYKPPLRKKKKARRIRDRE